MKITVLGCGALGQLWLSALHRAGHHAQAWLKIGQPSIEFQLTTLEQHTHSYHLPANQLEALKQCDLLLVTLKAPQIQAALTPLLAFLPSHTAIILMHNGLGVVDELPSLSQPLLHAITTHAAAREGNCTRHNATGFTQLGPLNSPATSHSYLADILHDALSDVAWYDDIRTSGWKKLAVNAVINPLTVKYQCNNGNLLTQIAEITELCQELALVLARENIHGDVQQLTEQVVAIIQATAANTSSMLQDVLAHRSTEIDYITGFLLKRARQYGLSLPRHHALYQLIKEKELVYATSPVNTTLPSSW